MSKSCQPFWISTRLYRQFQVISASNCAVSRTRYTPVLSTQRERERGRNASAGRLLRSFITRRCAFCSPQLRASVCPSVRVGGCRRHKSLSICNNHAGALTIDRRASANARHLFPRAPIAPPPERGLVAWRSGVVRRRMNEVTARRARLLLGWVTVYGHHLGM